MSSMNEVARQWSVAGLRDMKAWKQDDYPLWHDQQRMADKLGRARPSDALVGGEGCWVTDVSGRRLLDARAGVANVILGYSRQDITEAMHRQALELPFGCAIRYDRPALASLRYAAELVDAAPSSLTRVRLTHMGSASIENALQMARLFHRNLNEPQRTWILSLSESYHGTTLLALAASGQQFVEKIVIEPPPKLAHTPLPSVGDCAGCTGDGTRTGSCVKELRETIDLIGSDRIAALILEPVVDRHVIPLTSHYLSEVRRISEAAGFLLIFDEVITGFGRLGTLFGANYYDVVPDILCLAKGITSGYSPLGAVLVSEAVYSAFDRPHGQHFPNGSSTDGHPISCAAASATLSALLSGDLLDGVASKGMRLRSMLRERLVDTSVVVDVRGIGMLTGIELADSAAVGEAPLLARAVERACDEKGVLVQHGLNMIELYPPLIIADDEIDLVADRVSEAIAEVARRG